MDISVILFYVIAFLILASALMMVFSKNLVHSALFMVLSFLGVAGVYTMLNADFLAVVQVLVYVGAISILMVFGIMLTRRGNIEESNLSNRYKFIGGLILSALFLILERFILISNWAPSDQAPLETTVAQIADLLLNKYIVPFETSAILLLVALVGAIIIGKGVENSK